MLAQIPNVTPQAWHTATLIIVGLIMVAGTIVGMVLGIMNYRAMQQARSASLKREMGPQPFLVSAEDPPVTRSYCKREHEHMTAECLRMQERSDKIAGKVDQNEEYSKTRRKEIYEAMGKTREATVDAVKGLEQKIESQLGQIFDLLRQMQANEAAQKQASDDLNDRLRAVESDVKILLRRTP
jgi:hypothetical protein